jgi:hypothetical protein
MWLCALLEYSYIFLISHPHSDLSAAYLGTTILYFYNLLAAYLGTTILWFYFIPIIQMGFGGFFKLV